MKFGSRRIVLTMVGLMALGGTATAGLFRRPVVVVPAPTYVVAPAPVAYVSPAPVVRAYAPATVVETPARVVETRAVYVPSGGATVVEAPASYLVPAAPVLVRPLRPRLLGPRAWYVASPY